MFEKYKALLGQKGPPNSFFELPKGEIENAEKLLGYTFPTQLRAFYEEVGYGFLQQGTRDADRDPGIINRVIPPIEAAELVLDKGNDLRPDGGLMPGELPFFDLGDRVYLILKPNSSEPNKVWWLNDEPLTESVVEFFDRLYERAGFYQER